MTGHHWISESILAAVIFPLISIFLIVSGKLSTFLKAEDLKMWSRGLAAAPVIAILGTITVYIQP